MLAEGDYQSIGDFFGMLYDLATEVPVLIWMTIALFCLLLFLYLRSSETTVVDE